MVRLHGLPPFSQSVWWLVPPYSRLLEVTPSASNKPRPFIRNSSTMGCVGVCDTPVDSMPAIAFVVLPSFRAVLEAVKCTAGQNQIHHLAAHQV